MKLVKGSEKFALGILSVSTERLLTVNVTTQPAGGNVAKGIKVCVMGSSH